VTEEKAWEEALIDARKTLQNHLDTIDELNSHASHTLRFNAIIVSVVSAGLYQTSPPRPIVLIVGVGVVFLGISSFFAFKVLHTDPVYGGIPPSIYEDLDEQTVNANQYYEHIGGKIYPTAIRDARKQSNKYSDALNKVYISTGIGIMVLVVGGVAMWFNSSWLAEILNEGNALLHP
jgi:hypothetical protein